MGKKTKVEEDPRLESARAELKAAVLADAADLRIAAGPLKERQADVEVAQEAHRDFLAHPDPYDVDRLRHGTDAQLAVQTAWSAVNSVCYARNELVNLHREFSEILGPVDQALVEGARGGDDSKTARTQNAFRALRQLERELAPPEPERPEPWREPNPLPR